jgi:ankyrin repeat protein
MDHELDLNLGRLFQIVSENLPIKNHLMYLIKEKIIHPDDLLCHDSHGLSLMHYACNLSNAQNARAIFQVNPKLNDFLSSTNLHPLHYAANNYNFVKYYVSNFHPEVSELDDDKQNLLFHTSNSGVAKILIHKTDIDPYAKDFEGNSIIHNASKNGSIHMVNFFVSKCPSLINSENDLGQSPLHLAVMHDFYETARILITNGANVHKVTNSFWCEPIHFARSQEALNILISNGADINVKNLFHQTPIMHATLAKDTKAIEIFIRNHADLHLEDCFGANLIHYADEPLLLNLFKRHGVDLNHKDHDGFGALHHFAINGNFRAVKSLITLGGNPGILDSENKSALFFSVNYPDVFKFLIDKMDVKTINLKELANYNTILHELLLHAKEDLSVYAISKGADIYLFNREIKNPILIAMNKNLDIALDAMIAKITYEDPRLDSYQASIIYNEAIYTNNTKIIDSFMEKNIHPNIYFGILNSPSTLKSPIGLPEPVSSDEVETVGDCNFLE